MNPTIAACSVSGDAQDTDKDLKAALINWLPTTPRRIDRLILQALLCTAPLKAKIRRDCGLYLASRHPARATMGSLLDSVCVHQLQPKPFEFVNSVSNAAGFHVAAQLGLEGPNLFIGAGPNVWKHLQALAGLDLADGLIGQALLVMIDEDDEFKAQAVLIERPSQAADFAELTAGIDVLQLQL
ncbi:hypothetical protein Pstr01_05180 [Pseudomonas straminea]|uniref:Beta-ketoacyl synthase, N-terminal domain n=1 Tax=Pseudomonas straminea TaxID=47882 RepID=A0A1I1RXB0_PSEOC|nr:hypothetical protein [Pseudomonas straminea]GLX12279.1 hypothetical protein Pstr01_05180 [Pseudomonas straminea]SFD35290.1 hypothetical protein SAMN05216372_101312 [Pseudomonas straminea]